LGLGEIFDRAVTLYVRNFAGFSIIALFLLVPISIANYFVLADQSTISTIFMQQIAHPHPGAAPPALPFSPALVWLLVAALLLTPFANVATAIGVARLYAREPVDWQSCYRRALARWPQILLVLLVEIAVVTGAIFAGALGIGIFTGLAIVLFRASAVAGVVAGVAAFLVLLAWLVSLMLLYLAAMFMFDAVGIEGVPVGAAIGSGFARIFNRSEFWRAVLAGLAIFAIQFGLILVATIAVGIVEAVLKSHLVDTIAQGLVSLLSTAFLAVLIAVYYYDVRVRREGLDLQASVERLTAGT
jgi:hypothetical protein